MKRKNNELTAREKQQIKRLVISSCANYSKEYGCLPLDSDCIMLNICYKNSIRCKYFNEAVLPTEPKLQAMFNSLPITVCKQCGNSFIRNGKRIYCSENCTKKARRIQTAERVRKYRNKM